VQAAHEQTSRKLAELEAAHSKLHHAHNQIQHRARNNEDTLQKQLTAALNSARTSSKMHVVEIAKLESESQQKLSKMEAEFQARIQGLQSKLDEETDTRHRETTKWTQEKEALSTKLESTQKELDEFKRVAEESMDELRKEREERMRAQFALSDKSKEVESITSHSKQLDERLVELQDDLAAMRASNSRSRQEVEEWKRRVAELQRSKTNMIQEIHRYETLLKYTSVGSFAQTFKMKKILQQIWEKMDLACSAAVIGATGGGGGGSETSNNNNTQSNSHHDHDHLAVTITNVDGGQVAPTSTLSHAGSRDNSTACQSRRASRVRVREMELANRAAEFAGSGSSTSTSTSTSDKHSAADSNANGNGRPSNAAPLRDQQSQQPALNLSIPSCPLVSPSISNRQHAAASPPSIASLIVRSSPSSSSSSSSTAAAAGRYSVDAVALSQRELETHVQQISKLSSGALVVHTATVHENDDGMDGREIPNNRPVSARAELFTSSTALAHRPSTASSHSAKQFGGSHSNNPNSNASNSPTTTTSFGHGHTTLDLLRLLDDRLGLLVELVVDLAREVSSGRKCSDSMFQRVCQLSRKCLHMASRVDRERGRVESLKLKLAESMMENRRLRRIEYPSAGRAGTANASGPTSPNTLISTSNGSSPVSSPSYESTRDLLNFNATDPHSLRIARRKASLRPSSSSSSSTANTNTNTNTSTSTNHPGAGASIPTRRSSARMNMNSISSFIGIIDSKMIAEEKEKEKEGNMAKDTQQSPLSVQDQIFTVVNDAIDEDDQYLDSDEDEDMVDPDRRNGMPKASPSSTRDHTASLSAASEADGSMGSPIAVVARTPQLGSSSTASETADGASATKHAANGSTTTATAPRTVMSAGSNRGRAGRRVNDVSTKSPSYRPRSSANTARPASSSGFQTRTHPHMPSPPLSARHSVSSSRSPTSSNTSSYGSRSPRSAVVSRVALAWKGVMHGHTHAHGHGGSSGNGTDEKSQHEHASGGSVATWRAHQLQQHASSHITNTNTNNSIHPYAANIRSQRRNPYFTTPRSLDSALRRLRTQSAERSRDKDRCRGSAASTNMSAAERERAEAWKIAHGWTTSPTTTVTSPAVSPAAPS